MRNKAIIIGATSGIGRALAVQLKQAGYDVGLTGRRLSLLQEIQHELGAGVHIMQMDVCAVEALENQFDQLVDVMGGIDLVIICAGTGFANPELDSKLELQTIQTNVSGFVVVANVSFRAFKAQNSGQLAAISSIMALRGSADAAAYSASKAFMSNYLESLQIKAHREGLAVSVTDIRPGFVDTEMASADNLFWVAPPEKAARQIINALKKKKNYVYITKRWRLIAWFFRLAPMRLYSYVLSRV
jgi:short-subunit dehydrogenase